MDEDRLLPRTLGLDAVVVVHAAGVEGVAGPLAGAPAVEDAAVLAVPQEGRRCTRIKDHVEKKKKKNTLEYLTVSHVRLQLLTN